MDNTSQNSLYYINCSRTIHQVPSEGIYRNQTYALFTCCQVLFIPCFILNLLLFISILRNNTLRTLPNCLIANVLLNNTLIAISLTVWSYNFLFALFQWHSCLLYHASVSAGYTGALLSVIEVTLLALNRYISICHPWFSFEHKACIKKSFVRCIFLIWVLTIVFGSVSFLTPQYLYIKFATALLSPVAVILSVLVHVKSYYAANSVMKKRKSTYGNVRHLDPRTEILKKQDRRLHIITCVVILQLVLCFSPLAAIIIYSTVTGPETKDISTIFNWAVVVAGMKTLFNPLTFLYQLKAFRKVNVSNISISSHKSRGRENVTEMISRTSCSSQKC